MSETTDLRYMCGCGNFLFVAQSEGDTVHVRLHENISITCGVCGRANRYGLGSGKKTRIVEEGVVEVLAPEAGPAACGRPGTFEAGYDTGGGPLWDHLCAMCLPEACRLMGLQIDKWVQADIESHPSSVHVGYLFHEKHGPCEFDPNKDPGIKYNPDMGGECLVDPETGVLHPPPPPIKPAPPAPRLPPPIYHFPPSQGMSAETLCGQREAQATTGLKTMVTCKKCLELSQNLGTPGQSGRPEGWR